MEDSEILKILLVIITIIEVFVKKYVGINIKMYKFHRIIGNLSEFNV